jgi:phosphoenolpyruvate synthase/pyruvate phosphate dikinase
VTTAAFRMFIEAASDTEGLYRALAAVDIGDVSAVHEVGESIRATLLAIEIPDEVSTGVRHAWETLGSGLAYALRSSATAEDLPDASFAGQQDSFLNVTGEEALLSAIRRCWVSLFTDRAIVYRARNGFDHRHVHLAVVVQEMVMADASGVAFAADPVTLIWPPRSRPTTATPRTSSGPSPEPMSTCCSRVPSPRSIRWMAWSRRTEHSTSS